MRFTTRVLLLQVATVVAVVAVATAVYVALAVGQLRAQAEHTALGIARTFAEDPDVRAAVAGYSAAPVDPDAMALRDGPLQADALAVTERTDALFVVVTDDHGIRLAHPDAARLGEVVSTDYHDALAGRESVEWERGTLGESARAKVPVRSPGTGAPIGEVSVGFARASVFDDLPALLGGIGIAGGAALAIGALAALVLRRRWERLTLGLQPEELVALVQNQAAVLDGVGDGVVALDTDRIVRVCNAAAERMLGLRHPIGQRLDALGLPDSVLAALETGTAQDGVVVGDRVLYLDTKAVVRDGRSLGDILIVRDRTDLVALAERLETVRAMTGALRVQRHEFANRMHVASGLIDAERVGEARTFLADLVAHGAVDYPIDGLTHVTDPFLQAFLGANAIEAAERGVRLAVDEHTLLLGVVDEVEDVATVLGNLLGNATEAACRGDEPRGVRVTLLSDGDALVLTVDDTGPGIAAGADVFTRTPRPDAPDTVHGHGFGLPLSREIARRRGGDLWIVDPGGEGSGATFGARLPRVLRDAHRKESPA